jgi:hypothetical protein
MSSTTSTAAFRLIDPVDDPPLRAQPRTPQARQLITQRLADPARDLQKRAGDELDRRRRNVLRQ